MRASAASTLWTSPPVIARSTSSISWCTVMRAVTRCKSASGPLTSGAVAHDGPRCSGMVINYDISCSHGIPW
jgi:hypothetical protein